MNSHTSSSTQKLDVYALVTERIMELLRKGTIPWRKPWKEAGIPANLLSKRPYRGINLWLLLSLNYQRNLFLTWDQVKKLGASVRQGEHGHVVIYWKVEKKKMENGTEEEKRVALLRYYKVFNVAQCRDLPKQYEEPVIQIEHDPILECEAVVASMQSAPAIKHKEQKAYYHIKDDYINMPRKKSFETSEAYYGTLFHELVHSTGSEKRLNRPTITDMAEFGSEPYSIEELIAEMGASFLCSYTGILDKQITNSTAYITAWLEKLHNDKTFVIRASAHAQRAVDYILNAKHEENKEDVEQAEVVEVE